MIAVSLDRVQAVWPEELTIAQERQVGAWIDAATLMLGAEVRRRGHDLDKLVALVPHRQQLAELAVINAVVRVLRNPHGVRQWSETDGPFTESRTIDSSLSTGELYISKRDLDALLPRPRPQFGTIGIRAGFRP